MTPTYERLGHDNMKMNQRGKVMLWAMMQRDIAWFLDFMNLFRNNPARKVADPPAGTINNPTIWAALPLVIPYWCSMYLGMKEAMPETMMASRATATDNNM